MLMACPTWGLAQKATIGQPDSLAIEYKDSLYMRSAIERFADTRLFKATYLGVPLIIGGLIEKHQDNKGSVRKVGGNFFILIFSFTIKMLPLSS